MTEHHTFNQLPETTPEEIQRKSNAYEKFCKGAGFNVLKAFADTQVAQFFIEKSIAHKDGLITDGDFRFIVAGHKGLQEEKITLATRTAFEHRFFHWFIEFPEVFNEGGFDCVLGNPPFLGGLKISLNYSHYFLNSIHYFYQGCKGTCDLVAYFFRRAFDVIKENGFISLISTNTISQGDTRSGALDLLCKHGTINFAIKSMKWPGLASVEVALVTIVKQKWAKASLLNNLQVNYISPYLDDSEPEVSPYGLNRNKDIAFVGSFILGDGFFLEKGCAEQLINNNPDYKKVIYPVLNGDEINSFPEIEITRYVINFFDFSFDYVRSKFPHLLDIIEVTVKPERDKITWSKSAKEKWWLYERARLELYNAANKENSVLVSALTGKYLCFTRIQPKYTFTHAVGVIVDSTYKTFALLQNSFHEIWAWKYCSSMGISLRYTPSDGFQNFPFPVNVSSDNSETLEDLGREYYEHREYLMFGLQYGLTKIYNLFHSKEITSDFIKADSKLILALKKHLLSSDNTISFEEALQGVLKLRELHVQLNQVFLNAYRWDDVELSHDFYELEYLPENDRIRFTLSPASRKEVLQRLLKLNHEIHAEDEALYSIKKSKPKKAAKATQLKPLNNQLSIPMRPESAYGAIYSVQDVVRITKLSASTIKRWLDILYAESYEGISKDNTSNDQPLLLNFYGIHELIVIYDLRVVNKIPLKEILEARKWLVTKFSTGPNFYPFTSEKVLDTISKAGKQIIFKEESTGDFITLGKGNEQLNLAFIKEILKRIVFDKEMVSRLYLSDTKLTAIDPTLAGGRPCTVDNGILIDSIKSVFLESQDVSYIANVYEISEDAVKDALSFDRVSILN